jgi:hypothetical protein
MVTKSFRKKKSCNQWEGLTWTREGTTFLFQVEGGVEGGVFCTRGGALMSRQVCMSPSWPAKKILFKIRVNLHLNTLAFFFWWFSFLILSQVLCLKLNCHIYKLKWCVTWKPYVSILNSGDDTAASVRMANGTYGWNDASHPDVLYYM